MYEVWPINGQYGYFQLIETVISQEQMRSLNDAGTMSFGAPEGGCQILIDSKLTEGCKSVGADFDGSSPSPPPSRKADRDMHPDLPFRW